MAAKTDSKQASKQASTGSSKQASKANKATGKTSKTGTHKAKQAKQDKPIECTSLANTGVSDILRTTAQTMRGTVLQQYVDTVSIAMSKIVQMIEADSLPKQSYVPLVGMLTDKIGDIVNGFATVTVDATSSLEADRMLQALQDRYKDTVIVHESNTDTYIKEDSQSEDEN